ncbi:MAG: ATP-binding cassette domain-containing protein [Oscillatoria sp. PMC 1068.18]|nr:ATP-binding cassette domain-containing protein [Oscillatoria sp. PMC 1076.18]MEC4991765.1 ATP-binding cassette domain-containing protein [Oscillatoria sp. PMC 1068.18]
MTTPSSKRTVVSGNPYIVLNNQGQQSEPLELTKPKHTLGRDPNQVDLLVPVDWNVVSSVHAIFQQVGEEYKIFDGNGVKPSTNKLYVERKLITPTEGYLLQHNTELQIGQNPKNLVILTYYNPNRTGNVKVPEQRFISLANRSVLLGRDLNANLQLDAPTVSRRHAVIDQDNQGRYLLHDHSTNGVFVNDRRVSNSTVLNQGAKINIGPYTLVLQGDRLAIVDRGDNIRLDADNLVRIVKDKDKKGQQKTLLDNISLPIEPGQFVALVGGSGAGKSTLMRTLLGIDPTTSGKVFLNGEDLRKNFNIYRTQIGYVPQKDIVHQELTVEEVLTYAAKLRLPSDIEVKDVVEKTLEQIEMPVQRNTLVSKLSGGQLKRVSIGVELLADPKLFFLDEPTSGLDPGLDKTMMLLLRKLADQGRTIILVTHATTNITLCDRIVFLGFGGKLGYFGPPEEATSSFGISSGDFADIYNFLADHRHLINAVNQFRNSDYYQRYISDRLSLANPQTGNSSPQKARRSFFQQLILLTQRYFQLIIRDPINLLLNLFTAPIGIFLITFAIRDQEPLILGTKPDPGLAPLALRVLFVFTCAAIWVGLSSSLQEIVKESAIYLRERLVNLGLFAYLGSKTLVLGGLAIAQSILVGIVILLGFASPEPELISWFLGLEITTFLTLFTSMSLGLMVSAIVKNSSQANSALPLLLLPQIIFAGVLFKMEGIGKIISWLMLSRWSVGAYGSLVNVNSLIPEARILPDGSTIPLPFENTPIYDPTWENLGLNWGILILHAVIYLAITWLIQKRKDIF